MKVHVCRHQSLEMPLDAFQQTVASQPLKFSFPRPFSVLPGLVTTVAYGDGYT